MPHTDHETQCPQSSLTKAWVGMSPFIHSLSILHQPPPNHPLNLIIHLPFTYSIYLCLHPPTHPKKAMATHSSTLAWKIPWTEEPGRLQSMGSQRVRHDWATSLSLFTFMHWKRKWQPTPLFLPGESQGRQSLVGCCLWGRTESDTTEGI